MSSPALTSTLSWKAPTSVCFPISSSVLSRSLIATSSFEFDRRGRILDRRRNAPGSCDC